MSGTYRSFRQGFFNGWGGSRFAGEWTLQASLLDDAYVFSEAHVSVATSLAAHFVGAARNVHAPSTGNAFDPEPFAIMEVGPSAWPPGSHSYDALPLPVLWQDDAFGNFAPVGEDVTAVVIYDGDDPLLYLDDLTGLPGTTLGGEVELTLTDVLTIG